MDDSIQRQMHVGVGLDVTDSQNGLNNITKQINDLNKASEDLAKGLAKAEKGVGDFVKQQQQTSNSTEASNAATKNFVKTLKDEVAAGVKPAKQALEELKKEKERLDKVLNDTKLREALSPDEYKKAVAELAQINKTFEAEIRANDKQTTELRKQNLRDVVTTSKKLNTELADSFKAVNKAYSTGGSNLENTMFNTALQVSGVRAITSEVQKLGTALIDINYNTINNQRLMGNFSTSLRDELNDSAVQIAKNSGILITDAQEIQGSWIRINDQYAKSSELLTEMSDKTAKFMNVAEITDAESAVKLLNSSLLQFNLTGKDVVENLEMIGNKFAFMADKTAMGTADEYSEAISKMGANIKNMNGDIDDAIVLTSIIGDKLAKNGQEAGNSLNTFTAYMQRAKTLNLFDDLAEQLGDANIRIREGDKGLKDFKGTLDSIASAYSQLKAQGDEQGMNKIIEALGATRQRATAQAILEGISSEDGQNLEYYYGLLRQATQEGSYLEQQNEILMDSLKKQFNVFVTSLQEAGLAWGNSGILDGANLFLKGISGVLELIGNIPAPIMTAVSAFVALKGALLGIEKIGELTGFAEKFSQAMNGGTQASRDMASETAKVTQAFISSQQSMFSAATASDKLSTSYQSQYSALNDFKASMVEHNKAYADGAISAAEYNARVQDSTAIYRQNMVLAQGSATSEDELANAKRRSAEATNISTTAEKVNTRTKKEKVSLLAREKTQEMAKQGYEKAGIITQTARNTVQAVGNSLQKVRAVLTGQATAAETADTAAKTVGTVATGAMTAATTALGVALNFLLSPMVLITAAIGAFTWLTGQSSKASQELQSDIDNLTNTVNESKERIAELKDQQQRVGLSGYENEELAYLQKKVELEEQSLKIKQQEQSHNEWFKNNHWFGNPLNIGGSDNNSEKINDAIDDFKAANAILSEFEKQADASGKSLEELENNFGMIEKSTEQLNSSAADIVQWRSQLEDALKSGLFSPEDAQEAQELLDTINEMFPEIEQTIEKTKELEKVSINKDTFNDFQEELKKTREGIGQLESDIETLSSGEVSAEFLNELLDRYSGFSEVASKSTKEQIDWLRAYSEENADIVIQTIDSKINEIESIKESLESELESLKSEGLDMNSDAVVKATQDLNECNSQLERLQTQKDIELNIDFNNAMDFSSLVTQMNDLVDSTKSLTEAQYKLANGTALSKTELWSLAQEYPELLYQANLFADGSVESQKSAIDATLDMKNQEFNSVIDLKIAELQAEQTKLQNEIAAETEELNILSQMKTAQANGELETEAQVQEFLTKFDNEELKRIFNVKDQESDKAKESAENQVTAQNQAGSKTVDAANETGKGIAQSLNSASSAGAEGMANMSASGQQSMLGIAQAAWNAADALAAAGKGERAGISASLFTIGSKVMAGLGSWAGGNYVKSTYNSVDGTINGLKKSDWIEQTTNNVNASISSQKLKLAQLQTAIDNLTAFKNLGLSGVANNYYPANPEKGSSAADKAAKQAAKDAEKAAKEAEKAAKAAAKAAEEERKAIESIRNSYIKNVEDLQDRIAKALKKKYEEQYNERKKFLQKEHDERIKQIQDEIDKINGDTPENKKDKLEDLKDKLAKWKKDDSTLGKAKQKEYMDQIKELEKEIKIDELESKLDEENKKFDTLIDTENANCDKILATLTQKMDDEHLYKEANDMITNGKITEIVDLLTTYDSKWNGWATLMGQSAGDIIANQVKVAMANYVDVLKNAITSNGGVYTNQVTGGGGSSSSTSKPASKPNNNSSNSSSKPKYKATVTVTNGTTLWDLAIKYYGDPYKWTKIQKANGNVDPRKLRNGSKLVIPFKSGGYTGNQEGLAYLHAKEQVLTDRQTEAFHSLVFDFLPQITSGFNIPASSNDNHREVNLNAPLTQVTIEKVENHTNADVRNGMDNLNRMMKLSVRKSGILLKK